MTSRTARLRRWAGLLCLAVGCQSSPLSMNAEQYASILSVDLEGESSSIAVDGIPTLDHLEEHVSVVAQAMERFTSQRISPCAAGCPSTCCQLVKQAEIDLLVRDGGDRSALQAQDFCHLCVQCAVRPDGAEADRILIHIHGGLVSKKAALRSAKRSLDLMKAKRDFYPVFIHWETSMLRSYVDQTFCIRNGKTQPVLGILTSPFFILADLGRALGRSPVSYLATGFEKGQNYLVQQRIPIHRKATHWEDQMSLSAFDGHADFESPLSMSGWNSLVPGAARLVTTLGLDTIGMPAYLNMRRRANLLFVRDVDYERGIHPPTGAVTMLMRRITEIDGDRREAVQEARDLLRQARQHYHQARELRYERFEDGEELRGEHPALDAAMQAGAQAVRDFERLRPGQKPIHITLIAHSMGAHVANEIIRRNPDLHFENIVYMGAACSIREFAESVIPYIQDNPHTKFFNLTLHPKHERNDRYAYGTVPHGSLLVWIDSFITRHESPLDYTLGRWNNIAEALPSIRYLTSDVRKRIFVRAFGNEPEHPKDHGDFDNGAFWEREFWTPNPEAVFPYQEVEHPKRWRQEAQERSAK